MLVSSASRSMPQRLACQISRVDMSIAVSQPYLQQTVSMHNAKPRSRISAFFCSVWPATTVLPEKWGCCLPRRTGPSVASTPLLDHRQIGHVVGVSENDFVGFVVGHARI